MTDNDLTIFSNNLTTAFAVYRHTPSAEVIRAFFLALRRFSLEQVQNALNVHLTTNKFAPTIADLCLIINPPKDPAALKAEASIAFEEVCIAINRADEIICEDKRTARALRMIGGARRLGMSNENDPFIKRDFIEAYISATDESVKYENTSFIVNNYDRRSRITIGFKNGVPAITGAPTYALPAPEPKRPKITISEAEYQKALDDLNLLLGAAK